MISDEDRRQVERLQNLVQGFGWSVVTTEYTDEFVKVVLTRPPTGEPAESGAGAG